MSDFLMPALGADMEDGTLVEWLIKPGDRVKRGDVVAVVETQKGAIEVEIFDEGVVSELAVPVGTKVAVGGVLARIGDSAAPPPEAPATPPAPSPKPPAASPAAPAPTVRPQPTSQPTPPPPAKPAPPPAAPAARGAGGAKITPAARRRAEEIGIDAAALAGTGIEGSVTLADVEAAAASEPVAAAPAPSAPVTPRRVGFDPAEMRKAIATAMARSKREIPHYYLNHTVDLGAALTWLETYNAAQSVPQRLLPAVLLLKASALALREVSQLNGTYADGAFLPGDGIHPGWAISLRGGGLVAPAIRDADRHPLPDLMAAMRDLVQRARSGGLRASELSSPTVTITSLGERSALSVTAIIYPPQVAIIGFGTIAARPWVVDRQVALRPLVAVSLAADHRASDGHTGARLLTAIERLLQEPQKL
jgi:pyruvate dehydrogenase E2 component (dihydrolipoyllysine-residue acetyltransferase)